MSLAVCDHFGWLCGLKARSHGAMCDCVFKIFPMRFSVLRLCSHNPFFKSQLHSQKLHRVNEPSRVVHMVRFFLNATAIFSKCDCNGLCWCQWYCSDDAMVMCFCVWCHTWIGSTSILCTCDVRCTIVMCDSKLHTCIYKSQSHHVNNFTKMHLKNRSRIHKRSHRVKKPWSPNFCGLLFVLASFIHNCLEAFDLISVLIECAADDICCVCEAGRLIGLTWNWSIIGGAF